MLASDEDRIVIETLDTMLVSLQSAPDPDYGLLIPEQPRLLLGNAHNADVRWRVARLLQTVRIKGTTRSAKAREARGDLVETLIWAVRFDKDAEVVYETLKAMVKMYPPSMYTLELIECAREHAKNRHAPAHLQAVAAQLVESQQQKTGPVDDE